MAWEEEPSGALCGGHRDYGMPHGVKSSTTTTPGAYAPSQRHGRLSSPQRRGHHDRHDAPRVAHARAAVDHHRAGVPIRDTWKPKAGVDVPVPTSSVHVDVQPLGNWVAPPPTRSPPVTLRDPSYTQGRDHQPQPQQLKQSSPAPPTAALAVPYIPPPAGAALSSAARSNERVFDLAASQVDAHISQVCQMAARSRKTLLCCIQVTSAVSAPHGDYPVQLRVVQPQLSLADVLSTTVSVTALAMEADTSPASSSSAAVVLDSVSMSVPLAAVAEQLHRLHDVCVMTDCMCKCSFAIDGAKLVLQPEFTALLLDMQVTRYASANADVFSAWNTGGQPAPEQPNIMDVSAQANGTVPAVTGWRSPANSSPPLNGTVMESNQGWDQSARTSPVNTPNISPPKLEEFSAPKSPISRQSPPVNSSATAHEPEVCRDYNRGVCQSQRNSCVHGLHVCNFRHPNGQLCLLDTHRAGLHGDRFSNHSAFGSRSTGGAFLFGNRPPAKAEICNSWNRNACRHPACRFVHRCQVCNSTEHPATYCPQRAGGGDKSADAVGNTTKSKLPHELPRQRRLSNAHHPGESKRSNLPAEAVGFCHSWNMGKCDVGNCLFIHACAHCKSPEHRKIACTVERTRDSFCDLFNVAPFLEMHKDKRGMCPNKTADCPKVHACLHCHHDNHTVRDCGRVKRNDKPRIVRDLKTRIIRAHPDVNPLSSDVPAGLRFKLPLCCEQFNCGGECEEEKCEKPHICDYVNIVHGVDGVEQLKLCGGDHAAVDHPESKPGDLDICPEFNNNGRCGGGGTESTVRCPLGWHICGNCKVLGHSLRDHHASSAPLSRANGGETGHSVIDNQNHTPDADLASLAPYCYEFGMQTCLKSAYHCPLLHACEKCYRMGHAIGACSRLEQSRSFHDASSAPVNVVTEKSDASLSETLDDKVNTSELVEINAVVNDIDNAAPELLVGDGIDMDVAKITVAVQEAYLLGNPALSGLAEASSVSEELNKSDLVNNDRDGAEAAETAPSTDAATIVAETPVGSVGSEEIISGSMDSTESLAADIATSTELVTKSDVPAQNSDVSGNLVVESPDQSSLVPVTAKAVAHNSATESETLLEPVEVEQLEVAVDASEQAEESTATCAEDVDKTSNESVAGSQSSAPNGDDNSLGSAVEHAGTNVLASVMDQDYIALESVDETTQDTTAKTVLEPGEIDETTIAVDSAQVVEEASGPSADDIGKVSTESVVGSESPDVSAVANGREKQGSATVDASNFDLVPTAVTQADSNAESIPGAELDFKPEQCAEADGGSLLGNASMESVAGSDENTAPFEEDSAAGDSGSVKSTDVAEDGTSVVAEAVMGDEPDKTLSFTPTLPSTSAPSTVSDSVHACLGDSVVPVDEEHVKAPSAM